MFEYLFLIIPLVLLAFPFWSMANSKPDFAKDEEFKRIIKLWHNGTENTKK